tara:strand:+ start:1814 stop:2575 length:762 start_codon:yes stop_codon:yes gene_type:complete
LHSDLQTFKFVLIISIFSALLLSLTSTTLKNRQEVNIEVDRKKNVLKCAGIDVSTLNSDAVIKKYQSFITEKVITTEGDLTEIPYENLSIDENKSTGQITYYNNDKIMSEDTIQKEYLPLFEYKINGKVNAYILPISGKGLWSTLYGYFAISDDLNTVKGITFYKHGETPGLGGEIEKKWFQDQFINKKIFDESKNLVSIKVAKGIANTQNINHEVDGMSGATITGNGLTSFLKSDLTRYLPFIDKQNTFSKI